MVLFFRSCRVLGLLMFGIPFVASLVAQAGEPHRFHVSDTIAWQIFCAAVAGLLLAAVMTEDEHI